MVRYHLLKDEELLAYLTEGKEFAFNEIYDRYWKLLYNEAFKRTRNSRQSEEVVQDILTKIWTNRFSLAIDNLKPYLLTAVKFTVFNIYKREKRMPSFEEPLENVIIDNIEADSELFLKELIRFIEAWLQEQPEKRRQIFKMRYLDELSTREISEILHISQKTVQNTLLQSNDNFRNAVEKFLTILPILLIYSKYN